MGKVFFHPRQNPAIAPAGPPVPQAVPFVAIIEATQSKGSLDFQSASGLMLQTICNLHSFPAIQMFNIPGVSDPDIRAYRGTIKIIRLRNQNFKRLNIRDRQFVCVIWIDKKGMAIKRHAQPHGKPTAPSGISSLLELQLCSYSYTAQYRLGKWKFLLRLNDARFDISFVRTFFQKSIYRIHRHPNISLQTDFQELFLIKCFDIFSHLTRDLFTIPAAAFKIQKFSACST